MFSSNDIFRTRYSRFKGEPYDFAQDQSFFKARKKPTQLKLTKMLGTRTREAADDVYAMYVQATWVLYHHFLCKAFCTFMF